MTDNASHVEKLKQLTVHWADAHSKVAGFVSAFIHDYNDAQDVIQEVAKAAVESIDSYDTDKPFGPWILGVARFKVVDYLRKHGRDKLIFDTESIGHVASAYSRMDARLGDMKAALSDCMNALSKRDRRALHLRYVESLKPAKIAVALGVSANTTRVLLHRIRQALADCVQQKMKGPAQA